jgi:hypothetical protein
MIGYVEAPRAWWLTHGMAKVRGVNLPHAVVDGWLTRAELAALVTRCQTCDRDARCAEFLARAVSASPLPEYCPNAPHLEALGPQA